MSGKMNWARARLYGRQFIDKRWETDLRDEAAKWIARAQSRQRERKSRPLVTALSTAIIWNSSLPPLAPGECPW
jgi:hypothetical protein